MTILTIELDCKKFEETIKDNHRGKDRTTNIVHEEVDLDKIKIIKKKCDWGCICQNSNSCTTNTIPDLIQVNSIYDESKFLIELEKIIDNNIYVKICRMLENYDSGMDIREAIRSYCNPLKNDISSDIETSDLDGNDDLPMISVYPFITDFKKTDTKYIAKIHVNNDYDLNHFYLTFMRYDDSWSCCCSLGSCRTFLPVQLSLILPSKLCDQYAEFNEIYDFKKNSYAQDEYTHDFVYD